MDIDALIAKYLKGACTPDERSEFERWRKSSPQNEKLFLRSEEAWRLACADPAKSISSREIVWAKVSRHIFRQYSRQMLIRVAAVAASVALLIGFSLSYWIWNGRYHDQNREITLNVPGGVRSKTTLPDGTVVWLNSSSTLRYPLFFDGNSRNVELIGEAFFEVKPDRKKPFMIRSNEIQVRVVGTSFNFRHYTEDSHAVLAVETGKVSLSHGSSGPVVVSANQYVKVDNSTGKLNIFEARNDHFSSWRDNKIIFRNEPFGNVLNELSRKYNVLFEIRDDQVKTYTYTATFENLTLEDILELLKMSSPINYKSENLTINQQNAYERRKIMIYSK